MPWWAWALVGVVAWLWMARLVLRWSVELEDWKIDASGVLMCLTLWPVGFCSLVGDRLAKSRCGLDDRTVRLIVGESEWHRRERLDRERADRERAFRQAERELGIGGDE